MPKKVQKIHDSVDLKNTGILFWQQSTLENIAKLSGPLAKTNEFQIHYWALVVRHRFNDDSIIDVTIPTVIYNYDQKVSSAHIDFELKDVEEVSKALEPLHNMVTNDLIKQITQKTDFYTHKIEFLSVPLNTMHRHPTGVSSFSSTDLRKDHETDTGIVFPLHTANETPSFSSIIYNNPVKMIHTEYRIATGSVDSEDGINYRKGRVVTYVKDSVSTVSMAEQMLGFQPKDKSFILNPTNIPELRTFIDFLNDLNYQPNTQFIKADNVSKKEVYKYSYQNKTIVAPSKSDKSKPDDNLLFEESTVKEIKEILKLDIKQLTELSRMPYQELKIHLLHLERYYYSDDSIALASYQGYTHKELVDTVFETQGLIIDDYMIPSVFMNDNDELETTFEEKCFMLQSCGVPLKDLNSASDEQISKWYEELKTP